MENKHIEFVKKWLADRESVTPEELKANSESAYAAWSDDDDVWAADAARAAYLAASAAWAAYLAASAAAVYWVKQYEELMGGK